MRFKLFFILSLSCLIPVGTHVRALADEASGKPNVIFFLSDDQRADFLGCAGHPVLRTPNIDKLARNGVRFTNMFVTTAICAASRASLFTGTVERTHGYTFGMPPIPKSLITSSYPAVLKASGYRTGFVGKFGVGVMKGAQAEMFDMFVPLNRTPYFKKQPDGSERHVSEIAGDKAIAFLKERPDKAQPFCLSVSFNAPHAEDNDKENQFPWPKAMDGLYDDVEIPAPELTDAALLDTQPDFLKNSLNRERWFWRWDTSEKYQKNVRAYYRMISGVDNVIGRVLAEVARLGLSENTVVIFSGDNGYYRGDRNFAGKWSHYEEALRVPLVIYDPRIPALSDQSKTSSDMTLNIDIPATIVDIAGVTKPQAYQGASLLPTVRGEIVDGWRGDMFCEHLMNHKQIPKWEGVRNSRYKYARYFDQEPPYEFLHDLQIDPREVRNLATDDHFSSILDQLRQRCDALKDGYAKAGEAARAASDSN